MDKQVTPFAPGALSFEAQALIRASKADNTRLAYDAALRDFDEYCRQRRVPSLPAAPEVVVAYLEFLARGQKTATIEVKLAAIHYEHDAKGAPDPTRHPAVRAIMAGIRRTLGTAGDKKDPVTLEALRPMVATLGDDLAGIRNRALLLVGFAGAFRRSELVALDLGDVKLQGGSVRIQIRRSKTDQAGAGAVKVIPRLDDDLCPVQALVAWLGASGIIAGALFRPIDRWGKLRASRLTGHAVATIVKAVAEAAGLDPAQFSGHSLRAGFATQAALAHAPEWEIQEVTGHHSAQVLRGYIRDSGSGQIDAIRRAFGEK